MNDVLEEVTSETITKDHVVKRVDDWVDRLNKLYEVVEGWLPPGWHAEQRGVAIMAEEMMRKFNIRPRDIPVLQLKSGDGRSASLEPRGLWVVGVNGRLDLLIGPKHFLIVDRAKNFATPDWQIVDFHKRKEFEKFDKARLAIALGP